MATTNENSVHDTTSKLGVSLSQSTTGNTGGSEIVSKLQQTVVESANAAAGKASGQTKHPVDPNKVDRPSLIKSEKERLIRESSKDSHPETYLQDVRNKYKAELVEAKKAKDSKRTALAECTLAALREVERERNKMPKDASNTKPAKKVENGINQVLNAKSKTAKKKAGIKLLNQLSFDKSDLPRAPAGEKRNSTKPVQSGEKPTKRNSSNESGNKSENNTSGKESLPTGGGHGQSDSKVKIEKPKTPNGTKTNPTPAGGPKPPSGQNNPGKGVKIERPKKEKKEKKNTLFDKAKTQDKEFWRINLKDESTRRWLYDLYSPWGGVHVGASKPGTVAKIIEENCHDSRYDKYIQPVVEKVKPQWFFKCVADPKNFIFDHTFDPLALATLIVIPIIGYFLLRKGPTLSEQQELEDIATNDAAVLSVLRPEEDISTRYRYSVPYAHLFDVTMNESSQIVCTSVFDHKTVNNVKYAYADFRKFTQFYEQQLVLLDMLLCEEFEQSINVHYGVFYMPINPDEWEKMILERIDWYDNRVLTIEQPQEPSNRKNKVETNEDDYHEEPKAEQHASSTSQPKIEEPAECESNEKSESIKQSEVDDAWNKGFSFAHYMLTSNVADLQLPKDDIVPITELETLFENRKPIKHLLRIPDVANDEVSFTADVISVSEDGDVVIKKNRPIENRCFVFKAHFKDERLNDPNAMYAINVQHLAEIFGRVQGYGDIKKAIELSLSSSSETNFKMPYQSRFYLLSEQMLIILTALRKSLTTTEPVPCGVTSCKITEFRFDPKIKLIMHDTFFDNQQRAYQLLFNADTKTGVIPINERTLRYAIPKRFGNGFDYVIFCCAYRNIVRYLEVLYDHDVRIEFNADQIDRFVAYFCDHKHLTFKQRRQMYELEATVITLLSDNPEDVCTLLYNSLKNDTKVFIKDEIYGKDTTPRFIVSPSPFVKIIFGTLIHQIEDYLYSDDNPTSGYYIKGMSEDEIRFDLNDFSSEIPDGYVFVANDYNNFEGSQPKPAQAIIFGYWFSFTNSNSIERDILNIVYSWVTHYNYLHNAHFSIYRSIMKNSGLDDTSPSNGELNRINLRCCCCVETKNTKTEGDDSISKMPLVLAATYSKFSMFPCTGENSDRFYDLSFCGRHLDNQGEYVIDSVDERLKWDKFNTFFSRREPALPERYTMAYMRWLSMKFKYPNHPFVEHLRREINEHYGPMNLRLDTAAVRDYYRRNWYSLQYSPFYKLIRPNKYQYPSSLPDLTEGEIRMISNSRIPARRFEQLMLYKADTNQIFPLKTSVVCYLACKLSFIPMGLGCKYCIANNKPRLYRALGLISLGTAFVELFFWNMILIRLDQWFFRARMPHRVHFEYVCEKCKDFYHYCKNITLDKFLSRNNAYRKLVTVQAPKPKISSLFGFHPALVRKQTDDNDADESVDPDLREHLDLYRVNAQNVHEALNIIAKNSDGQPVSVCDHFDERIREFYEFQDKFPFDPHEDFRHKRPPQHSRSWFGPAWAPQALPRFLGYLGRLYDTLVSHLYERNSNPNSKL